MGMTERETILWIRRSTRVSLSLRKRMPIFAPERGVALRERLFEINLELALYRSKVLARNFQLKEAEQILEKTAVQSSPKNRFVWHVWVLFEANQGDIEKGWKLLKIGHALNPRDPVLLHSLALLEYKHSAVSLARVLFRRASEIDPRHRPLWFAWGWMEWKEGNINTAMELYQRAVSIDSTSESAARCLQRTEVSDDASCVMGFLDMFDSALDSIKRLLQMDLISPQAVRSQEI